MSKSNRRTFIKKSAAVTLGFSALGSLSFSPKSYARIVGANDRLNVAIAGLGRRLSAYYEPIGLKSSNVNLLYLCDAMQSQMPKAAKGFEKWIDYQPKQEQNIFKVLDDKEVDVLINATPDHWHALICVMASKANKHIYCEKPLTHSIAEGRVIVDEVKRSGEIGRASCRERVLHTV
jgi:predicted dehydrogenase